MREVVHMRLKYLIAYVLAGLLAIGVSSTALARGGGGGGGMGGGGIGGGGGRSEMGAPTGGSPSSQGLQERTESKGVEGAEQGKDLGKQESTEKKGVEGAEQGKHKHLRKKKGGGTTPAVPTPGTPGATPAEPANPKTK